MVDNLITYLTLKPVIAFILGAVIWLFAGSAIFTVIKNNPFIFLGVVSVILVLFVIRMRR